MDEKIIIPILLFLAAGYSAYRANKAIHSGSTRQAFSTTTSSDKNVTWFQTGAGWFAAIFFVAAVIVTIAMILER